MALMQPPVLDSQAYAIPYDGTPGTSKTYDIPFIMPATNNLDDLGHIQVSIKYANTNESAVNENKSPDNSVLYFAVDGVKNGTNPFFVKENGYYVLKIPYSAFKGGFPALATTYAVQIRFGTVPTWAEGASPSLMGIVLPDSRFSNWRIQATNNVPSQFGEWSNVQKVYCYGPATINLTYNLNDFVPEIVFDYAPVQDDPLEQCKVVYTYQDLHGIMSKSQVFNGQYNQDGTYTMKAKLPVAPVVPIAVSVEGVTKNNTIRGAILNVYPVGAINPLDTVQADLGPYVPNSEETNDGVLGVSFKITQPMVNWNFTYNLYRSNIYTLETIKVASGIQPVEKGTTVIKDYSVEMGEDYIYTVGLVENGKVTALLHGLLPWNYKHPTYQKLNLMDSVLLTTRTHQLRLQGNVSVSGFKRNTQDSFTNTIGSQYPFYQRSAKTNYRTLTLNGLVSINFDKTATFMRYDPDNGLWWDDDNGSRLSILNRDLFAGEPFSLARRRAKASNHDGEYISTLQHTEVPNDEGAINTLVGLEYRRDKAGPLTAYDDHLYDAQARYYDTLPTDKMIYIERKFREFVMSWLSDGKPKLFRSETEGNMIVILSGISFTPLDKSSRMVYSMSATVTEIAEYNLENLVNYNLVPTDIQSYTEDGNLYKFNPGNRDMNVVKDLMYWWREQYDLPDMYLNEDIVQVSTADAVNNAIVRENVRFYSFTGKVSDDPYAPGSNYGIKLGYQMADLATGLPTGLDIDKVTGVISGRPTSLNHNSMYSTIQIQEQMYDDNGRPLYIVIGDDGKSTYDENGIPATTTTNNGNPYIRYAYMTIAVGRIFERLTFRKITEEIPFAVVGEEIPQFSIAEYVDGGIEPYIFSSSDLPSGLSISSDGTISGAYAKPYSSLLNGNQQAHAATIVVYDKSGQRAVQTIHFGGANYPLSYAKLNKYNLDYTEVNVAVNPLPIYETVSGGIPAEGLLAIIFPQGYAFNGVGLPDGLSVNPYQGVIEGTPQTASTTGLASRATLIAYDMRFNEDHARYPEIKNELDSFEAKLAAGGTADDEIIAYYDAIDALIAYQNSVDLVKYQQSEEYRKEVQLETLRLEVEITAAKNNITEYQNLMNIFEDILEPGNAASFSIFYNNEQIEISCQPVLPEFKFLTDPLNPGSTISRYNIVPDDGTDSFQMGIKITPRVLMNEEVDDGAGNISYVSAVSGGLPYTSGPPYRFTASNLLPDFTISNDGVITGLTQVQSEERVARIFAYDARGKVKYIDINVAEIRTTLKFLPDAALVNHMKMFEEGFRVGQTYTMTIPLRYITGGLQADSLDGNTPPYNVTIEGLPAGLTGSTLKDAHNQWNFIITGTVTDDAYTTASRTMTLKISDNSTVKENVHYKIYGGPVYRNMQLASLGLDFSNLQEGETITQYIGEVKYGKEKYSLTDVDDKLKLFGLRIVLNDENQTTNPSKIYITGTVKLPDQAVDSIHLVLTDGFGKPCEIDINVPVTKITGQLRLFSKNSMAGVQLVQNLSQVVNYPILSAQGGTPPYVFSIEAANATRIVPGVTLNQNDGTISGTPTEVINSVNIGVKFKVTDATGREAYLAPGYSWWAPQVVKRLSGPASYTQSAIPANATHTIPAQFLIPKTGLGGETLVAENLPDGIGVQADWSISGLTRQLGTKIESTLTATAPANQFTPAQTVVTKLIWASIYGAMGLYREPEDLAVPGGLVGKAIEPCIISKGLTGAVAPVTWSIDDLPANLTWEVSADTLTCSVVGTVQSDFQGGTITIHATDTNGTSKNLTIPIGAFYGQFTFEDKPEFDVPAMTNNESITMINFNDGVSGGSGSFAFSCPDNSVSPYSLSAQGTLTGNCGTQAQAEKEATIVCKDLVTGYKQQITIKIGKITGALSLNFNGAAIPDGVPGGTFSFECARYVSGDTGTKYWMVERPDTWPAQTSPETEALGTITIDQATGKITGKWPAESVAADPNGIKVGVGDATTQATGEFKYGTLGIGAAVGAMSWTKSADHNIPAGTINTKKDIDLGIGLVNEVDPVAFTIANIPTGWNTSNFVIDNQNKVLHVTYPAAAVTAAGTMRIRVTDAKARTAEITVSVGIVTAS